MRWDAIYKRIKDIPKPIGVEIGVYRGELSANILRLHQGLFWIMIDPWDLHAYDGYGDEAASEKFRKIYTEQAKENLQAALQRTADFFYRRMVFYSTLKQFLNSNIEFIPDKNFFDIGFIDGNHSYESVKQDNELLWPLVKPGGWISGHDYGVFDGVTKAVDELFGNSVELDEDFTWFVRKV